MILYDWNTMPVEQLNPRMTRQVVNCANMTVARIGLRQHATVPEHSHTHEQVSMVQSGALKFVIAGREQVVRAGEVLAIASNEPHSAEALEDSIIVDVFSPPREDWTRGDDRYLRR
jgi:quercetin dioxygenase-like cupin family protein